MLHDAQAPEDYRTSWCATGYNAYFTSICRNQRMKSSLGKATTGLGGQSMNVIIADIQRMSSETALACA